MKNKLFKVWLEDVDDGKLYKKLMIEKNKKEAMAEAIFECEQLKENITGVASKYEVIAIKDVTEEYKEELYGFVEATIDDKEMFDLFTNMIYKVFK